MPGVELQSDSTVRKGAALNSALGVGFDAVNGMAEVLLLPSLVLAFFVAELTPSYMTIGLVPAVATSIWTLARVPALLLASDRRRHQPWAFAAALTRVGAIAILAIMASRTSPSGLVQSGRPLLVTFFLCLIVFTLAGGFGSVPTSALLRASISADAWPTFIRWRSAWTAGLAIIGALFIARVLGSSALAFPGNFGRLFLVAAVCLIASAVFLFAMREPDARAGTPVPDVPSVQALRHSLRDGRFRRFLAFRVLLSSSAAVDPFLFLYAVTRLGAPPSSIGTYAVAGVLGWVATSPAWLWLERSSGPRAVLQSAAVLRLVAPAIALSMPYIADTPVGRGQLEFGSLARALFALGFFAIGAALAAQSRGNSGYLTPLATWHQQSAYSGITNAVLVIVAFAPVVGGYLIQRFSYEVLFMSAIVVGLAAVFASSWMVEVAPMPRGPIGRTPGTSPSLPGLPPSRT